MKKEKAKLPLLLKILIFIFFFEGIASIYSIFVIEFFPSIVSENLPDFYEQKEAVVNFEYSLLASAALSFLMGYGASQRKRWFPNLYLAYIFLYVCYNLFVIFKGPSISGPERIGLVLGFLLLVLFVFQVYKHKSLFDRN